MNKKTFLLAVLMALAITNGATIVTAQTVAQKKTAVHQQKTPAKPNVLDVPMVYVEGGTFTMGSDEPDADRMEKPAHQVTLHGFNIGKYEVTQALWVAVMANNPSRFKGNNLPVEQVGWAEVQDFIKELNIETGKHYRLPTEAEWEYAAKGGTLSKGFKYAGSFAIAKVAWYADNSGNCTHPVGQLLPNELGIYDMTGNVAEWCSNWYNTYTTESLTDPKGPVERPVAYLAQGGYNMYYGHANRGGDFRYTSDLLRVTHRNDYHVGHAGEEGLLSVYIGLRLVLEP